MMMRYYYEIVWPHAFSQVESILQYAWSYILGNILAHIFCIFAVSEN